MNKFQIEARQRRGQEMALRFEGKIVQREDGGWLVPSETSRKRYEVDLDPTNPSCTCADHQETGDKCKHYFAALETRDRNAATVPAPAPTPPRPVKPTVRRDWSLYNEAQESEEDEFEPLLWQVCQCIQEPLHERGLRPVPWADAVFAATSKVYLESQPDA